MERYHELDSYQTFICIKYTYTNTQFATVTDQLHIANIFKHFCFSSIAEKTKANIKFLNKSFQDFLHYPNEEPL